MRADFYGHSIKEFDCLLAFFLRSRDLSAKMRGLLLMRSFVSPAEGTVVRWVHQLSHNKTLPIKGAGFTVSKLLGFDAPQFQSGFVVYLSPGNYHHVHSPANMTVEQYYEMPGELKSVAPSLIEKHPQLFAENLRQVVIAKTDSGMQVAVVLVGAQNVGAIHCPKLIGWEPGVEVSFTKGEPLGYFSLGSTVVVLLDQEQPSPFEEGTSVDVLDPLFGEDDASD